MKDIVFVPLGTRCTSAGMIDEQFGKREFSLPFDWIDLPIKNIKKFIECDNIDEFLENYFSDSNLHTQYHSDRTWFPHDIVKEEGKDLSVTINEAKEKFNRRLKRLHELLLSDRKIVFITVLASDDKGSDEDYFDLIFSIERKRVSCENSYFIGVNIPNGIDGGGNVLVPRMRNFYVPIIGNQKDFDTWRLWEIAIANRIKNNIDFDKIWE